MPACVPLFCNLHCDVNGLNRSNLLILQACTEIKTFLKYCFFAFLSVELKNLLSNFVENETILDYDREAELALQRLTTGDVEVNQLTNAWTRSYVEVKHISVPYSAYKIISMFVITKYLQQKYIV